MSNNSSSALRQFIGITISHVIGDLYSNAFIFDKFFRAASVFLPLVIVYAFYEYIERLVVSDANNYEESIKKRNTFMRKMAFRLEQLSKEYGDFYFSYLPMNHGIKIPPIYALFHAITEVLNKNNRPVSKRKSVAILMELAQFGRDAKCLKSADEFEQTCRKIDMANRAELNSSTDLNSNIMQLTREMVILGVKDLEIMAKLHHLIEAV